MKFLKLIFISIFLIFLFQLFFAEKEKGLSVDDDLLRSVHFTSLCETLLNTRGASPNAKDENAVSILMYAVVADNRELVQILINKGADVNYRVKNHGGISFSDLTDESFFMESYSALDLAVLFKNYSLVNVLIDAGANRDAKLASDVFQQIVDGKKNGFSISQILFNNAELNLQSIANSNNSSSKYLHNPLFLATCNNDYEMLFYLSHKGVSLDQKYIPELLVSRILYAQSVTSDFEDRYYGKDCNGMDISYQVILFWENQGFCISAENIFKAKNIKSVKDSVIKDFIEDYNIWKSIQKRYHLLEDPDVKFIFTKPQNGYAEYTKHTPQGVVYLSLNQRNRDLNDIHKQDQNDNPRITKFVLITLLLALLFYMTLYSVYSKHGTLEWSVWVQEYNDCKQKIQQSRVLIKIKQNLSLLKSYGKSKQPTQVITNPLDDIPERREGDADLGKNALKKLRGWSFDQTVSIAVTVRTIEDRINTIQLCNDHEKTIRRMMWYLRMLEEYSYPQIKKSLGENGLLPHLVKLWNSIDLRLIRSIYLRSFYLLVQQYAKRDKRVLPFLDVMERDIDKYKPATAKTFVSKK